MISNAGVFKKSTNAQERERFYIIYTYTYRLVTLVTGSEGYEDCQRFGRGCMDSCKLLRLKLNSRVWSLVGIFGHVTFVRHNHNPPHSPHTLGYMRLPAIAYSRPP